MDRLKAQDLSQVRVLFVQGGRTYRGEDTGAGEENVEDRQNGVQHLTVIVPASLHPGSCRLMVVVDDTPSAPISIDIMPAVVPAVIETLKPSVAAWADPV